MPSQTQANHTSVAEHQQNLHYAARATGAEDALNNTGIDFEVGVLHTSATLFNGTSGFVSG
jgi:hypothetical protein